MSRGSNLWDSVLNKELTPDSVAIKSNKSVAWKGPDGRQWQQTVIEVVKNVKKRAHLTAELAKMTY